MPAECRWRCEQDLNSQAIYGVDGWEPSPSTTPRGFGLVSFRDTYGQTCSVQESSNVEPHLWVGVDCCRMHLSPKQARGLAERLLAFADAEQEDAWRA
jgi:hypothetical protein